jgi:DnaJ-domain-containing protein 1
MGIIDRLGDVIKSYLNDEDEESTYGDRGRHSRYDPDLEAAHEELNDFLKGESGKGRFDEKKTSYGTKDFDSDAYSKMRNESFNNGIVPPSVKEAFAELGLGASASHEECKVAHKKLLKIHHPDRHAGHPVNMKKATEKSSRINAAFDLIERWRAGGKAD